MIDEYAIGWRRRFFEASGGFSQKGLLVAFAAFSLLEFITLKRAGDFVLFFFFSFPLHE